MEPGRKSVKLYIGGMTCINCQNKIEKKLKNTRGIKSATVKYHKGIADITYDAERISVGDIETIIEKLDYAVLDGLEQQKSKISRILGILTVIAVLYMLLQQFGLLNFFVPGQLADSKMGYGMLFVIGLITSIHCVAMCGGINLSQCLPKGDDSSKLLPSFLYNLGRVISYTTMGFLLGFIGALFGSDSNVGLPVMVQGLFKLIAGIFMVIMGINMLGIFPWLRRLNLKMPKVFLGKIEKEKARSKSPLLVGLLNGFMPCGPLQSIQIVALASGNPFTGAFSMLLFSLGTVPLMLGLGTVVSALGKRFTQKVMTVGSVLVVVLGLAMLSQGVSLSGFFSQNPLVSWKPGSIDGEDDENSDSDIKIEDGKQVINSTLSSRRYPEITVQAGIPVKWTIDAPEGSINGCNNRIFIQEYGIEYSFKPGENVIEFTPTQTGEFQYSCWMGMIRSHITVVDADGSASHAQEA